MKDLRPLSEKNKEIVRGLIEDTILPALIEDTILPALNEDLIFGDEDYESMVEIANSALGYLIKELKGEFI